jgi:hypothetical protein
MRSTLGIQYDVPRWKILVEGVRQELGQNPASEGVVVLGAYRIRPQTVTPHFRLLELAARLFVFDDPASARGAAPEVPDEDGGGTPPPTTDQPTTTRELQVGANYDVNRNVRIMGNVIVPVDDRPSRTTLISRLQVVF